MKRLFTLALSLVAVLGVQAQELLVGTYNVRYQNESDAKQGNGWSQRCPVICDILSYESPDIFGTQEAKVGQIHDLLKGSPNTTTSVSPVMMGVRKASTPPSSTTRGA